MSDGTHGHGSTLAGGTAGTIGNIISMGGPNQTRDSIDISTMDSSSKWREFIPGMLDAGEMTFECNYDGVSEETGNDLNTALADATPEEWTITLSDTSTWVCTGFVTALGFGSPFDDKLTQSVTIKFTGAPVYTDVA